MKVAICTPHYAGVHSAYSESLARLIARTAQTKIEFNGVVLTPEVEIFMRSSSTLPTLRNQLVDAALQWEANYLLWIDADHVFPADALLRLLSLNLPVVGANYPRRTYPTFPTALALEGGFVWTTQELAENGSVQQVASLGLGFCLIDMSIVAQLEQSAHEHGRPGLWPLFATEAVPGEIHGFGEDIYFFKLLREAQVKVYVDHALSWAVGHIHEVILTNADALAQKEAYLRSRGLPLD